MGEGTSVRPSSVRGRSKCIEAAVTEATAGLAQMQQVEQQADRG